MEAERRGLFITFEGGDGAGKTTQAEMLREWLNGLGHQVVRTREPGGTETGLAIRNLLLHTNIEIDPKAEALLYAADRAQHIAEVVRPALNRGDIIVQDRYIDSSIAYQGAGRVLEESEVKRLSEWATDELWPDLTILLDLPPEVAVARRDVRGEAADRLEREAIAFHTAVRDGFLSLADQHADRYLVLDARNTIEHLQERIRERVLQLL